MLKITELKDKSQTGQEMENIIKRFSNDINKFGYRGQRLNRIPLQQYYTLIKRIPYKKDYEGIEILTRPYHLLTSPWNGWDCKKKAIAIAAYLEQNGIPWRITAVSSRPDRVFHHAIVEGKFNDTWREIDATYPNNKLFQNKKWTAKETLSGKCIGRAPVLISMYGESDNLSTESTIEFIRKRQEIKDPNLGAAGTVATIIGVITGLIGALTGGAVAIAQGIRARRAEKRQKQAVSFQRQIIEQESAAQIERKEKQSEVINKWLLPAAIGVGILTFMG